MTTSSTARAGSSLKPHMIHTEVPQPGAGVACSGVAPAAWDARPCPPDLGPGWVARHKRAAPAAAKYWIMQMAERGFK